MTTDWQAPRLDEIAEVRLGRQRSPGNHHGDQMRPYLRAANVSWAGLNLDGVKAMNFTDREMETYRLQPGDIVLGEASGSAGEVGKPALWRGEIEDCAFQNTLLRVRAGSAAESAYLFHWFRHLAISGAFSQESRGVGIHHIGRAKLAQWRVPLPPIVEQRRIVEILEDHLSRLDAGRALLDSSLSKARAYARATLSTGLRGELVPDDFSEGSGPDLVRAGPFMARSEDRIWPVPFGWAWARVGDLFEVSIGTTPLRADDALWSGDLPWVSSGEVAFGVISSTRERISRTAAGNPKTRIHPPGTVMLAMIGEGKTRGQAAILAIEAAHNQNCASIRVSATDLPPEYVYGYLQERYLESRRAGSGAQQLALNKARIKHFPIPVPPLATQRRLVQAWADARDVVERAMAAIATCESRTDSLRRSLLQAAFSGQLTGHSPDLDRAEESIA